MSERSPVVLVVEDEKQIRQFVRAALEQEGCRVYEAGTSAQGLIEAGQQKPDLLVLDLGLPRRDGLSVLNELRGRGNRLPVLILTARDTSADKIAGLDAGADDYLTKPFDLPELLARLRAIVRRASGEASPRLEHAGVTLEPAGKRVTFNGQPITLSAREYALLHDLLRHKTQIRTRAQLEESLYAWGEETGSNTVEVYVHHLRKKFGAGFIRTLRGLGYQLGEPGEAG